MVILHYSIGVVEENDEIGVKSLQAFATLQSGSPRPCVSLPCPSLHLYPSKSGDLYDHESFFIGACGDRGSLGLRYRGLP